MEKAIKILFIFTMCSIFSTIVTFVTFWQCYPLKYKNEIIKFSSKNNLNPALVASVINCESGFRKNAKSNIGAIGLMQLITPTAEFINEKNNLKLDTKNLSSPEINIELGCAYLSYLQDKFDDKFTVLCAYNAGEGNVTNWLKDSRYSYGNKIISTPFSATNHYAAKVIKDEKIYKKFFV